MMISFLYTSVYALVVVFIFVIYIYIYILYIYIYIYIYCVLEALELTDMNTNKSSVSSEFRLNRVESHACSAVHAFLLFLLK
jgi:hypothetical protein